MYVRLEREVARLHETRAKIHDTCIVTYIDACIVTYIDASIVTYIDACIYACMHT
jgi:hypothetical protein